MKTEQKDAEVRKVQTAPSEPYLRLLFVLAMEHTLLRMFVDI